MFLGVVTATPFFLWLVYVISYEEGFWLAHLFVEYMITCRFLMLPSLNRV